jgi:hypothetical protein
VFGREISEHREVATSDGRVLALGVTMARTRFTGSAGIAPRACGSRARTLAGATTHERRT